MSEPTGWVVHWTNANGVACRREFTADQGHDAAWHEAQLAVEGMRAVKAGRPGPSNVCLMAYRAPQAPKAEEPRKPTRRRQWEQ